MFAPLPAKLDNSGKVDALFFIHIADDISGAADRVRDIGIRLLLSDPAAEGLPASGRLKKVTYPGARFSDSHILGRTYNLPPRRGIETHTELRLNNMLLAVPTVREGWLVFNARPRQFAVGKNLLSLRVTGRDREVPPLLIEMLEVHLDYE